MDAGNAAPCPNCGVHLYPLSLSWMQTWGIALGIIGLVVAVVFALAMMM
jgi:hypothetical protein